MHIVLHLDHETPAEDPGSWTQALFKLWSGARRRRS
jgi:hypothetical protein